MELSIRPYPKNIYPFGGVLIKHASVAAWLKELGAMGLTPEDAAIYPLPGTVANTVWGCLVLTKQAFDARRAGKHELCQQAAENLLIPERAALHPPMDAAELSALLGANRHLLHPELGLVELPPPLILSWVIAEPVMRSYHVIRPEDPVFVPRQIRSFQVKVPPVDDVLENLEKNFFPKKEKMADESLNIGEKARLLFYKLLFTTTKNKEASGGSPTGKTDLWGRLESLLNGGQGKESAFGQKMQEDYKNLEKRNQDQLNKLLDLLRNNPDEALKYAIPFDEMGSTRGGSSSGFTLSKRWPDFSLFGNGLRGGGGNIDLGDGAQALREQYLQTAKQLIKEKEYHKAAFIYMKLLKNNYLAAETLEQGGHYREAAGIYLKLLLNKAKAAECYEKGKMTAEAIALYIEMEMFEKAGDLYLTLDKRNEANLYYEKVAAALKQKGQYVKAALLYRQKMQDSRRGQILLLEGWRTRQDALNCLVTYFANIGEAAELKEEISAISRNEVGDSASKNTLFVQALRHPFKRHYELKEWIRETAYGVIAAQAAANPDIVSELRYFNEEDKHLLKDTFRFRLKKRL